MTTGKKANKSVEPKTSQPDVEQTSTPVEYTPATGNWVEQPPADREVKVEFTHNERPAQAQGAQVSEQPVEDAPADPNGIRNSVLQADSGAPADDKADPPPPEMVIARAYPHELSYGQQLALQARGQERYAQEQVHAARNEANNLGIQQAQEAVARQEASMREMRSKEEARQAKLLAETQKLEQVRKWGEINNTFATFFDGQRRLNAGILAAGLYRAGKPEHALQTLQVAMAHEYDAQKQAIAQAEAEGRQAQNSLASYRQLFQDERQADLAWELEANRLIANRAKAAFATAKTAEERASQQVVMAKMDEQSAMILDQWGKEYILSTNPTLKRRNTVNPSLGGQNLTSGQLIGQVFGQAPAGQQQPVGQGGNPPEIGPGGAGYPRMDRVEAARQGLARGRGEYTNAGPSGGTAAGVMSATDKARNAPQGSRVLGSEGRNSQSYSAFQQIIKGGKVDGYHQVTQGGGWAPDNMGTIFINNQVRLAPKEGLPKIQEQGAEFLRNDRQTAKVEETLAELRWAQERWKQLGYLPTPEQLQDGSVTSGPWRGSASEVNRLRNAYRKAQMLSTELGTIWWKTYVDPGSTIREGEREHIESMVPKLKTGQGLVELFQKGDIQFLSEFSKRLRQANADNFDDKVAVYGATPANAVRITGVTEEKDKSGKKTGKWAYRPADPGERAQYILWLPPQWNAGNTINSAKVAR